MVGAAMARDLSSDPGFRVSVVDHQASVLRRLAEQVPVQTRQVSLKDANAVEAAVADADIVLGALPSAMGLETMRTIIRCKKNYCDISFMADDPRSLAEAAREGGVTVVYDCGVAPGMSNMFAGFAAAELDHCENVELYVGGLPAVRSLPYQYKAGFSPRDVIEEYTRPARLVENRRVVIKEALSEVEQLEFPEVGTLEAFNTDGLRSLLDTIEAPNMREKTLRYPGHAELMRTFRELGLFSTEALDIAGQRVQPMELTARLLFPKWTFESGEADITVLRARIEGFKAGQRVRYSWDLLDRYDAETDTRSMSRTTAFPATIMARFIAEGRYRNPGVHPPEVPAQSPGLLSLMLSELERRGVRYTANVVKLAPGAR